ncbi:MAG: YdcF family protein [Coriobacteriia bacterium]|nr:YdcF family protein [Coriobacteriia bacterium]
MTTNENTLHNPNAYLTTGVNKRKANIFWWLFVSMSRGLAAFIAIYSMLSLGASLIGNVYNQNAWWIDFSVLPPVFFLVVQPLLTLTLGLFALNVPRSVFSRIMTALPIFAGLFTAIINTIEVYTVAQSGSITLGFPLPFSFFVSVGLFCILLSVLLGHTYLGSLRSRKTRRPLSVLLILFSFALTMVLFPVGQMFCFGTTDYRVKVDAAVVFGAQVFPGGWPSAVLQDRLDTAIEFYEEGNTPLLVMSGGIDVEGTNEAQAMRDYAIERGIPPQSIIMDEYGDTTKDTARNTVASLQAAGITKVATVSNFYHLARIKMLYLAEGMDVVTVPSQPNKDPRFPLFNIVREIPGWWYYWLQNLVE